MSLHPALVMLAGAVVVTLLPARIRPWAFLVAPVLVLVQLMVWLEPGDSWELQWLSLSLVPLAVDELSRVWAVIFTLVAIGGGVFALHLTDRVQQAAALVYGGSALGVVLAGDWLTVIVFWEIMAVSSMLLILHGGRPASHAASMRYLFVHVAGGSLMLGGILWHVGETGSIAFGHLDGGPAAWLTLAGVAVNAAVIPLHAWLTDAYPESSATGMVFLGAFTTKTAVYVLLRAFSGWEVLIIAGVVMALYAGVYALLQSDIRRLVAYVIVSQVGFMVAAVGVGGHGAEEVVADQAFTHVLWPALMVMATGAVMHATGTTKLSELGGLARPLRGVLGLYLVGALSLAVFPLMAGLSSEELFRSERPGQDRIWAAGLLYVAAILTVLAVAIKLPWHAFFGKGQARSVASVPLGMYTAMGTFALLSLAVGIAPGTLFDAFGLEVAGAHYTAMTLVSGAAVLALTALAGWALLGRLRGVAGDLPDIDWVYRNAATPARVLIQQPVEDALSAAQRVTNATVGFVARLTITPEVAWARVLSASAYAREHGPEAAVTMLGRPPLGVAIAAIFLTFAVVILLAQLV
jgi:multicomponent Na+:H+ antiporter subunit D